MTSEDEMPPLVRETLDGNIDAVKELLRAKNVDVNISCSKVGATPLLWASGKGHKDIVELCYYIFV